MTGEIKGNTFTSPVQPRTRDEAVNDEVAPLRVVPEVSVRKWVKDLFSREPHVEPTRSSDVSVVFRDGLGNQFEEIPPIPLVPLWGRSGEQRRAGSDAGDARAPLERVVMMVPDARVHHQEVEEFPPIPVETEFPRLNPLDWFKNTSK